MQAVTLEVIIRAVFGVSDPERIGRLRELLQGLLSDTAGPSLQVRVLLSRRFGRGDPLAELQRRQKEIDALLAEEVAERRADPNLAEREDILSLLVGARFEGGEAMADVEIRDQLMTLLLAGHETTATALAWTFDLLLRNPDKLEAPRVRARIGRRGLPEGRDLGVAAAAAGGPARRPPPELRASGQRLHDAGGHRRHARRSGSPTPARTSIPIRSNSSPSASSRTRPIPTAGSRSAAAFAAAWAPPSPSSRCASCCARPSPAASCAAPGAVPQGIARRNITFSPKNGTPVIVESRRAAQLARRTAWVRSRACRTCGEPGRAEFPRRSRAAGGPGAGSRTPSPGGNPNSRAEFGAGPSSSSLAAARSSTR